MPPLPEVRRWREGIDPERAQARISWLQEMIAAADEAIEAQQQLITHDGPLAAYQLSLGSLAAAQRQHENELADLMAQRELEVVDFALDGPRYAQHRARAGALSAFLHAMQQLYERIWQAQSTPRPGAIMPPLMRSLCQLDVAGFFPSSFGVRFTVLTRTDLEGHSLTTSALETAFDLITAANPIEHAPRVGPRAMNKYRHLVTTLIQAEATPKVVWSTPAGAERRWAIDDNQLLVLANRLAQIRGTEPRTVDATGTLTGASLRRQRFEFAAAQGVITGTAPRELAGKITEYFGKPCRITYVETVFVDEGTDQEKRARTLTDIQPV